jgi:large subunit ribosomal protein L24
MKIVKGDTVYLRSGRDVASRRSRLEEALHINPGDKPESRASAQKEFQEKRAGISMAEQIAEANKIEGVRGKVIRVMPAEGKVVVQKLNMVTRHKKANTTGGAAAVQQGGRIEMEAPLPISRVMLVCPSCSKPTRVSMRQRTEQRQTLRGEKTVTIRERVCKQCGEVIPRPTDTRLSG